MTNVYTGSAASLNGKVIANFMVADEIQITDETPAQAHISISGDKILYGNSYSITINNLGPGRYVTRTIYTNGIATGTDIRLQESAHNDFSGGGHSGILWLNDNGTLTDWLGSGSGFAPNNAADGTLSVPAGWQIAGTGDFNGDGRVDVLLRNTTTGAIGEWLGTTDGGFTANNDPSANATVPLAWHVAGIGDFTGNGRDDILWRNDNGTVTDWFGTGTGGFTTANNWTATVPTNWQVVGTGDFNGDGHDDILWRNDTGVITDWLSNGSGGFAPNNDPSASASVPLAWHVAGTGDFNGDGLSDILWRNDNGTVTDWFGTATGGFTTASNWTGTVPTTWHIASIGDFNADAVDDILWRNDNGTVTDWFGTATGGFTTANNWTATVPTTWHVQDPFL